MEVAAFVLSIISLGCTTLLTIYNLYLSNKMNKTNLSSDLYLEIYKEYLINKIPKSRKILSFDQNDRFIGYQDLQHDIIDFLEKTTYYRYLDEDYYLRLKEQVIELEDYLLNIANRTSSSDNLQYNIYDNIDKKLSDIYSTAQNKYLSGK